MRDDALKTFNTYNNQYLIIRHTNNPNEIAARYKSPEYILVGDGSTYLQFSKHMSAKYQQAAAFVYHDMMGLGEWEPDPIELGMFVEVVWSLPGHWDIEDVDEHLRGIARELDRSYGVDLWWTFTPTLRFEI